MTTNGHKPGSLDDALDDSFPASDPPSMTTGFTATPTKQHSSVSTEECGKYLPVYRVVELPDSDRPFGSRPTYKEGRWSSEGTASVYASLTVAGAMLEYLAHADQSDGVEVAIASALVPRDSILSQAALSSTWADYPYHGESQAIGDHWVNEHKSLALQVPSALAPGECNILINPDHVDHVLFTSVSIHPLVIDQRLHRSR
jgi:RES domain-containing protein